MTITKEMQQKLERAKASNIKVHYPEHSIYPSDLIYYVHDESVHLNNETCTIHNMSEHSMRWFKQKWVSYQNDLNIPGGMYRQCQHGVLHPDPDDCFVPQEHECDNCCTQQYPESFPSFMVSAVNAQLKSKQTSFKKLGKIKNIKLLYNSQLVFSGSEKTGILTLSSNPSKSSYPLTLAHAEDVQFLTNTTITHIEAFAYDYEVVKMKDFHEYVGYPTYPQINNDGNNSETTGYLLGIRVYGRDEDNRESVAVFSFLVNYLVNNLGVAVSYTSDEEISSIMIMELEKIAPIEDFCMSSEENILSNE